jgi:hypothetical protein
VPDEHVTIEVNGHEADQAAVSLLEHEGWGHFTAMQVRGGRTRGLGFHLSRLAAAHHDVYGLALGGQEVRDRIRHALGGRLPADGRDGQDLRGTITNVGFWRDGTVIWPDAPKLEGITMLVLRRQLTSAGTGQAEEPVRVQDLASYGGMILCNSRGWAPVGRVDDLTIPQNEAFTGVITAALDGCPWDEI